MDIPWHQKHRVENSGQKVSYCMCIHLFKVFPKSFTYGFVNERARCAGQN